MAPRRSSRNPARRRSRSLWAAALCSILCSIVTVAGGIVALPQGAGAAKAAPSAPIVNQSAGQMTVGKDRTLHITASGYPKPTITEDGALPSGVTFQQVSPGVAELTGTPAAGTGNDYSITLTATNVQGTDADEPYDLTVVQDVVFPSDFCPPTMTVGQYTHYIQTVAAYPPFFGLGLNNENPPDDVSFTQDDNNEDLGWTSGIPQPGMGGKYHLQYSADTSPPVGNGQDKNYNCTLYIDEAPTFTDAGTSVIKAGQALSAPLLIGGTTGYPKSVTVTTSGSAPPGIKSNTKATGKSFGDLLKGTPASTASGDYPITVTANNGITSSEEYVLVVQVPGVTPASTSVTLSSEADPVQYNASGQTYTATVGGGNDTTGYVQFSYGQGITTVPLVGGQASFTTPATLNVDDYTLTATYTGDATNAPSSATEDVQVLADATTVTLSGPSSVPNGTAATFSADVACTSSCGGAEPTGFVEFEANDDIYDVELVNGQADFTTDPTIGPSLANEVDATFYPDDDGFGDFVASSQVSALYDIGSVTLDVEAGDTVPTDPITAVPDGATVGVVGSSNTEFSANLDAVDTGNGTPPGPLDIDITTGTGADTTDITSSVVTQDSSEAAPSADPETGQSDYFWTIPANALYAISSSGTATVTISSDGSSDFVPISMSFTLSWS